jgi:iron complex outermembrane receptor protein
MAVPARPCTPFFRPHPLAMALCCALGTAWTPAAQAQPAPTLPAVEISDQAVADANGPLPLDKAVGTGSRLGLTARETPASVHIVDRAAIEARGAQDTQEILRSIQGVTAY